MNKQEFEQLSQTIELIVSNKLTTSDLVLFDHILKHHACLDGSVFYLIQSKLADNLQKDNGNISRSLQALCDANLLRKTEEKVYQLISNNRAL